MMDDIRVRQNSQPEPAMQLSDAASGWADEDSLDEPVQSPQEEPPKSALVNFFGFILETIQILIIVGVVSFLIRSFVVQPFYIKGSSMEPTLYENEMLMIDQLSYRFREPKRGEVIVLHAPYDTKDYIKRVIALPGESIEINARGEVLIDGIPLAETYLSEFNIKTNGELAITVPENEYFVMGDNRLVSNDSRGGGGQSSSSSDNPWTISKDEIVGKAFLRWWPMYRFSLLRLPDYNIH